MCSYVLSPFSLLPFLRLYLTEAVGGGAGGPASGFGDKEAWKRRLPQLRLDPHSQDLVFPPLATRRLREARIHLYVTYMIARRTRAPHTERPMIKPWGKLEEEGDGEEVFEAFWDGSSPGRGKARERSGLRRNKATRARRITDGIGKKKRGEGRVKSKRQHSDHKVKRGKR